MLVIYGLVFEQEEVRLKNFNKLGQLMNSQGCVLNYRKNYFLKIFKKIRKGRVCEKIVKIITIFKMARMPGKGPENHEELN